MSTPKNAMKTGPPPGRPGSVQMAPGGRGGEVIAVVKKVGAGGAGKPQETKASALIAPLPPPPKEVKISLAVIDAVDDERVCCKSDGGRFSGGGGGADTTVKLRAGRVYRFAVTSNPPLSFEEAATIRTRRAECYEPSFVESCCGSCCCSFGGGGRAGGAGGVKYADLSATEWSDGATLFAVTPASGSGSRVGGGGGGGAAGAAPAPTPAAGVGAVCLEWACDVEPTGRGLRGEIEIELRARGGYGAVRLALQAKVYGGGAKDGGRAARHGVALKAVEYACVRHGITGANRVLATTYLQR